MRADEANIDHDDAVHQMSIDRLAPDPFQPRLEFREQAIVELADSIELHGLLTPLLVRPMQGPNSRGRYWIVAGERRYRAAQRLGMTTLPCRIRAYENTAAAVVALAENVHRQDLSELEKAEALLRIKTLTERTWEQISELVKLSPDYVKRLVGLLKLAEPVKEMLRDGKISARVAIALKPLPPARQVAMAERAVAEGLGAEQIRELAQQFGRKPRKPNAAPPQLDAARASVRDSPEERRRSADRTLDECTRAIEEIDGWVTRRRWSPGMPPRQQVAVRELYARVSVLQQQLAKIQRCLEVPEESAAEKLRNATSLFGLLLLAIPFR
ncbi:MAG: parB-like partition protein [Armatimonadetes bacterium]|jgi:ParB family chromosome partitioning protein|nr:parB-like partition protein [Armatimonadota bacterium]